MTAEKEFSFEFKLIWVVQSPRQKYSCSLPTQITCISLAVSSRTEGRLAIVTNVGRDAVDVRWRVDEGAWLADGEVVWSRRPDAGVKLVKEISPAMVANKPGHQGEHEGNR
jgi:hypothetical protein